MDPLEQYQTALRMNVVDDVRRIRAIIRGSGEIKGALGTLRELGHPAMVATLKYMLTQVEAIAILIAPDERQDSIKREFSIDHEQDAVEIAGKWDPCPHWATSLDAITREVEAAGYDWQVRGTRLIDSCGHLAEIYAHSRLVSIGHAATAPAALCEAFLMALAERKGQGENDKDETYR